MIGIYVLSFWMVDEVGEHVPGVEGVRIGLEYIFVELYNFSVETSLLPIL